MNLFELFVEIGVKDNASNNISKISSGLGRGLVTAAKIGTAAVAAASTALVALTKMATDSYAEYEQLVGGTELMFASAYETVMSNAQNAYKTVQMSQNEYLQQVNGFATGLKTALGGNEQAAANLAHKIVQAEADIVAATGNTAENVQNAFNGIMKSNFTMLDNLQIGITPTKKGFQEVINKVNAWNRAQGEATNYQMGNLADMQSALVDYIDMVGMSGYAQREASETITGSLSSMKAAWNNLLTGLADKDADLGALVGNLVDSITGYVDEGGNQVKGVAQNIIPVIIQTVSGLSSVIDGLAPIIADALPAMVTALLPAIISAGTKLIIALGEAIITALPAVGTALLSALQIILTDVFGLSEEQASQFADGVTGAFNKIKDGFFAMVESAQTDGTWLNEIWTGLKDTGKAFCDFCVALWDVLSAAFAWCVEQINTEGTYLNTIWESIQTVISAAVDVIQGVITAFTAVLRGDWSGAWEACLGIATSACEAIVDCVLNTIDFMAGFLTDMFDAGLELFNSLEGGMEEKIFQLAAIVVGWITYYIVAPILDMGTDLYDAGVELMNQFWSGLESIWSSIASWWDGLSFSDKEANVTTNADGKKAKTGLNYVPYDDFPAILHRGEAVLTAAEARIWRNGGYGATPAMAGGITINQYIQSVPQTPVDLANATEAYFEQARWML